MPRFIATTSRRRPSRWSADRAREIAAGFGASAAALNSTTVPTLSPGRSASSAAARLRPSHVADGIEYLKAHRARHDALVLDAFGEGGMPEAFMQPFECA